jgi:hypothetical protein
LDDDEAEADDVEDDEEAGAWNWKPAASCVVVVLEYSSSTMVSSFAGGRWGALPPEMGCHGAASEKTPSRLRERDEFLTTWSRNDARWMPLAII